MDLKKAYRKANEPVNTIRPKMTLNKEARMILLMTKVQQSNSEALQEQCSLLEIIKNTRNAIKEELKIIKGTVKEIQEVEAEKEVAEEPIELVESDTNTKFKINPNLEIVRQIKKNAKSKLNTGHNKSEDLKHGFSNKNGVQHFSKHRKCESSNYDLSNRPPFK